MDAETFAFIAFVFLLAGFVKGVTGLGLPTISMGLLAAVMPPLQAAAILILPSFVTNVWQLLAGPALGAALRRLWPMLLAICIGTWSGLKLMTSATEHYGTMLLGAALAIYAISGLVAKPFEVSPARQRYLGPLTGLLTGVVTAATGVFVIPAVPYLQAIALEKEELVQALGLSFTVSTIALAIIVAIEGGLKIAMADTTIAALLFAGIGMAIGQRVRLSMAPHLFRRWFFVGLLLLGIYLVARSAIA